MRTAARIAPLAFALASCGDTSADNGWTMSVDTLPGGTIEVVNSPPAAETGPTWMLEEELRIGSVDDPGPATFGQIKAIVVDDSGRIAVLESQSQQVRIFAPEGTHLVTYGGKGAGPGEFENALGIMQTSDGLLYVPDERNARMSVIDPDSGFITSYPLTLYRWGFIWSGAMRDDDHVLVPSMVLDTRRDLLRVYAPDMTQVDTVLLAEDPPTDPDDPPGSFAWQAPGGMPRGFAPVPFYPRGAFHLDRTGEVWTTFAGDPSYRIARSTPGGDTTLIISTPRPPIPVTESERDLAMDAILEGLSRFGVRSLDASKIPNVKPAVLSLFNDDGGRLWVRTSSPDSLRRYDIYERDGGFVGTAATALDIVSWFEPVVRGDRFYALVTNELDVPFIVRARMIEPSRDDR
jgi:hypothetical protein